MFPFRSFESERKNVRFEVTRICFRKERDRPSFLSGTTRTTYKKATQLSVSPNGKESSEGRRTDPMDITHRTLREIIIHDQFDSLEIDPSPHDICTNQTPDFSLGEIFHCLIPLLSRPLSMDTISRESIDQ